MEREKRWISSEDLFSAVADVLADGKEVSFTVTGKSMWPLMRHGCDRVVVEPVMRENLKVGDIVLFQAASEPLSKYLLHRITKLKKNSFETAGDGNCFRDGWFPKEAVIGRAVTVIRPNRTISLNSPIWRVLGRLWIWLFPIRRPLIVRWRKLRD